MTRGTAQGHATYGQEKRAPSHGAQGAIVGQHLSRKASLFAIWFSFTCDCNINTVEGCHYSEASDSHVSSLSSQHAPRGASLPVEAEMRPREVRLVLSSCCLEPRLRATEGTAEVVMPPRATF